MKRLAFLCASALLPALAFASSTTLFGQKAIEVSASSSYIVAKPTTEININPVAEEDVRSYYAALDDQNLSGTDLLKALKPILKKGQLYYKYDNSDALWQMYEITDRDWERSPASEITGGTYNPSTGIIRDYVYGSNKAPGDNPYIHTLYRNPGVAKGLQRAWDGDHGKDGGIDREHIWPKSRGFGAAKEDSSIKVAGARGDIHHLWPGDHPVNSYVHNNNMYGFVDRDAVATDAGTKYKVDGVITLAGNYLGRSATFGDTLGNDNVFEPQDSDKGDIARACFYMVARYNNLAGDDETIDAGNPNLFLEDTVNTDSILSTPTTAVSLGILRDLLAWHHMDPVDEFEIHRNDLIYRNYNKNRNPFIDFPSWADVIWGTSTYEEGKVTAYDPTPQGVASPSVDKLNAFNVPVPQSPIVSIAIDASSKTAFTKGDSFVKPKVIGTAEDGSTRTVTGQCSFSGYDMNTVGKQTVTVTYSETIKTTYEITVSEPEPEPGMPSWMPYVLIGAGVAVVIVLIVLIVLANAGKGKTKKAARKALNTVTKSTRKTSSQGRKKKK